MRRLITLTLFPIWFAAAYAQDQPVPQDAQLTVVVKDEQGSAVAGAKVVCASTNHSTLPVPISEPLQGVTDAEGRCQFGPLLRATYYVLARTDTHGAWGRADLYGDPPKATLELTLKRGLGIAISVEDTMGKPIPGVALVYRQGLVVGRTDDAGKATLPNVVPGEFYDILFVKEGFGYVNEQYILPNGRTGIVLKPGAVVEGVVKDTEGKPLPGVLVQGLSLQTSSDDQGRYRLGWFPLGNRNLTVVAQLQKGNTYWQSQETVKLEPGALNADIVMRPPEPAPGPAEVGAVVEGKVVMKDTGEPVPSTIFYTYNNGPDDWYSSVRWKATERDGTFRLEGLMENTRIFLAVEPNRKTLYCVEGVVPVNTKNGETVKDVVLTVDEGFAISGRLLDAEGDGVKGAVIEYQPRAEFYRPVEVRSTGAFILSNLPRPGEAYTLTVRAPGQVESIQHTVEPVGKGEIAQTEIRLSAPPPEGKVRGLVVDTQGKPVPGAQINVDAKLPMRSTYTDDDGRYEMTYRLHEPQRVPVTIYVQRQIRLGNRISPVGPDVEIVSGGELNLEPNKNVEAERIVLKLTPRRHLVGRVTDPSGASVVAEVRLLAKDGYQSEYAHDGQFLLRNLPDARYVIEVVAQGYRARILEPGHDFPADAEEIDIMLQKGPFAENRSIFAQVTGYEETDEAAKSLPQLNEIRNNCRFRYPGSAGNKVQNVPMTFE